MKSKLNSEKEFNKMFFEFSKTLLNLSTERETSLKRKDYEMLLESVVENVNFINSGSVLLRDEEGTFYYVAAYNHDYRLLEKIKFDEKEIIMRRFKHVYVIKRRNLDLIKELSNKLGNIDESLKDSVRSIQNIKAFVSIPIRVHRRIVGFFNLDSWESEDVFERKNFIPVAEMISDLLSLSLERFGLIKELKEKYEEVNRLLMVDPVTFLPNSKSLGNYFDRYVAIAKRESSNLYLVRVKINNFDDILRSRGVEFGNMLLKKMGRLLTKISRKSDLIASLRGGTFVILSISKETPKALLERIQSYLEDFGKEVNTHVEILMSLCEYGKDGKDLDSLLEALDVNVYKKIVENFAKSLGGVKF
ncbi:MAG: diguanylate cyclase [Fervidobacterium sp.]|nr:diguanylate cyclase [Fervidobacterium sp.]